MRLRLPIASPGVYHARQGGDGQYFNGLLGDLRDYFEFRDRLRDYLRSRGCRAFEITLVTCYHPTWRKERNWVYVEGFDLSTPEKGE